MLAKPSWARTVQGIATRPAFIPARNIASTAMVMKKSAPGALPSPLGDNKRNFPSAYQLWFKDYASDRSNATILPSGKIDIHQLVKAGSSAWAAATEADKEPYVKKAAAEREEMLRERAKFWKGLSAEQRAQMRKDRGGAETRVLKRAKTLALRDREGYPDLPRNPWIAYLADVRAELEQAYERGDLDTVGEKGNKLRGNQVVVKEAAKRYKELSEAEKERYLAISKENREKYNAWVKTQTDL